MSYTPPWTPVAGESQPSSVGWFPVLIIWEPEEGAFPAAKYWSGEKWLDGKYAEHATSEPVAYYMDHPCVSADAAREIAYANDPDAKTDGT